MRPARLADSARIGDVHVQSSREAYADMLPTAQLAALDAREQAAMWRRALESGLTRGLAVAEVDGVIIGFAACAGQRARALAQRGYSGEVTVIYVLRAWHGRGSGRLLMRAMARRLIAEGESGMALWALSANAPARRFYERLGGVALAARVDDGQRETAYGWRDLAALAAK